MLKPGIIPFKEPLIRVGIILPEDNQEIVKIQLNNQQNYYLQNHQNDNFSLDNNVLQFSRKKDSSLEPVLFHIIIVLLLVNQTYHINYLIYKKIAIPILVWITSFFITNLFFLAKRL